MADNEPTTLKSSASSSIKEHARQRSSFSSSDFETASIRYNNNERNQDQINRLEPVQSYASGAEGYPGAFQDITLQRNATGATLGTIQTNDPSFEVDWENDDPENPKNWSFSYKAFVVFAMSYCTTVTVLFSTSYTVTTSKLETVFDVSEIVALLGVTTYLLGMAVGSTVLAPLSEMYGRKPIYLVSMVVFVVLILPCALAQNIEAILIPRFFGAFAAASLVSNAPGTINDIVHEEYRAFAFSIWSVGPMNGPVLGPIIGGFTFQYLGWRWTNWLVLILGGAAFCLVVFVKETYAPAILRKRAALRRKETGDNRWWSRFDEKKGIVPLLKVNLSRPFVMMFTEPICMFWDVYVGIVYGTLYLSFVAYPIVFETERGWSPGIGGLAFIGIGIGNLTTILSEPLLRRMINSHKRDPETGEIPPEAMVSVICIAAVSLAAGELIFAWTCTPDIFWVVPILAGIPFGAGNAGVFIYSNNYLVYSYNVYAASALAGNTVFRSVMGAVLPLAGPKMYGTLDPNWASTLLGLVEMACVPIPVIFYFYGRRIRDKSTMIRQIQDDKRRDDAKRARAAERAEKEAIARGPAKELTASGDKTGDAIAEEVDIELGSLKA